MKIRAISNHFVFKFVDSVNSKGEFEKGTTESGFLLKSSADDSAKYPRWVDVISAGPNCTQLKTGDRVLLPALRWTAASVIDGERFWKSDETQAAAMILSSTADKTTTTGPTPLSSFIIFTQNKNEATQSSSGLLLVISRGDSTPSGQVVSIGPDVVPEIANSTIYYIDPNFFDTFKYQGKEYAFIKEENVLMYKPSGE